MASTHLKRSLRTTRRSAASDLKNINRVGCSHSMITSTTQGERVSPTFEIEIKVNTIWLKHIS